MPRIPKILHYAFGLAQDFGGMPWSLVHHVCLKSAIERIGPERVYFYYEFEPSGDWWALSRDLVIPIRIEAPRQIFGRPLGHVAHRADVVRLQKLIDHGGIYLDSDVLVQRSFDDLLNESTVLGAEGDNAEFGLANAIILAEPRAPFLVKWLDSYRSFRGEGTRMFWNEHSVQLPSRLAKAYPSEVTVLPHTAFYWPLWIPEHIEWIFNSTEPIPQDSTYAHHLWESKSSPFLKGLTPGAVRSKDTNFHLWAKPFVEELPDNYGIPSLKENILQWKHHTLQSASNLKSKVKRRVAGMERVSSKFIFSEDRNRQRTFQRVYKKRLWGSDGSTKFFSGIGSSGPVADTYVECMEEILRSHARELGHPLVIVDIGCGDFRVGHALLERLPNFRYIGCDIVPELIDHNLKKYGNERITFRKVDVVCDELPEGHVCLIRQVFQHLSNADIRKALGRLPYNLVYVTEGHPAEQDGPINPDKIVSADVRFDWRLGRGRGVELDQPPFNLRTNEVLRVANPPAEILITQQVLLA